MSLWNRGRDAVDADDPERTLEINPIEVDLATARARIDACRGQLDGTLRRVGNTRPAMRDELLDLRLTLRTGGRA